MLLDAMTFPHIFVHLTHTSHLYVLSSEAHFVDALIFVWLPQICITIIRIFQRRNLRHRMVARTVVVADVCPVSSIILFLIPQIYSETF